MTWTSCKCCKQHVITVPALYNCHEVPQINYDTVFFFFPRCDGKNSVWNFSVPGQIKFTVKAHTELGPTWAQWFVYFLGFFSFLFLNMTNIKLCHKNVSLNHQDSQWILCRFIFEVNFSSTLPYTSRSVASIALQEVSAWIILLIFVKCCVLQVAQIKDKTKFLIFLPFFVPSLCKSLIARALENV